MAQQVELNPTATSGAAVTTASAPAAQGDLSVKGRHLARRPRSILVAMAALLASMPGVWLLTLGGGVGVHVFLVMVYAGILLVARKIYPSRTPWPYPNPVMAISLNWFVLLGLASLRKFLVPESIHLALRGNEGYLHRALTLVILATLLMWIGYLVVFPDPVKSGLRVLRGRISVPAIGIIWLISMGARGITFANRRFGYLQDPTQGGFTYQMLLTFLSEFAQIGLVALFLESIVGERRLRAKFLAVAIFIMAGEIVYAIMVGFKGVWLHTVLPAFLLYWGIRARIPLKAAIGVGIVLLLIAPGNYKYREAIVDGRVDRGSFTDVAAQSLNYTFKAWGEGPIEVSLVVFDAVTHEFADMLENLALMLKKTPSILPHRGAEDYRMIIPKTFLPRFLWKDKPTGIADTTYVTWYYREQVGLQSASPPGFVGDLYMRVGMSGVVIGPLFLGFVLGILTRLFGQTTSKRAAVAFPTILAATLFNTELSPMISLLVQRSVFYGMAVFLIYPSSAASERIGGLGSEKAQTMLVSSRR